MLTRREVIHDDLLGLDTGTDTDAVIPALEISLPDRATLRLVQWYHDRFQQYIDTARRRGTTRTGAVRKLEADLKCLPDTERHHVLNSLFLVDGPDHRTI